MHELDYVRPAQKGYYGLSSRSSYTAGVRTCYPHRRWRVSCSNEQATQHLVQIFKYKAHIILLYCPTSTQMAMVTTSAPVMGEVQIFHKETLTNPTDNIHNVGDFAAVITTAKKIPSSRQILSYWKKIPKLEMPILQLSPIPDIGNFNSIVYQLQTIRFKLLGLGMGFGNSCEIGNSTWKEFQQSPRMGNISGCIFSLSF